MFHEGVDVSLPEQAPQKYFFDDVGVGGLGVLPVVPVRLAHEVVEVEVQRGELVVDLLDDLVVVGERLDGRHVPRRVGPELPEPRLLGRAVCRAFCQSGDLPQNQALDDLGDSRLPWRGFWIR